MWRSGRQPACSPSLSCMLENTVGSQAQCAGELENTGMQLPSNMVLCCTFKHLGAEQKASKLQLVPFSWTLSTGSTATKAGPSRLQRTCWCLGAGEGNAGGHADHSSAPWRGACQP